MVSYDTYMFIFDMLAQTVMFLADEKLTIDDNCHEKHVSCLTRSTSSTTFLVYSFRFRAPSGGLGVNYGGGGVN